MALFRNHLAINRNEANDGKIRRYVHSPVSIEHQGVNVKILENGKVELAGPIRIDNETKEEYQDGITVSASVIFKAAQALRMTRKVKFVTPEEASKLGAEDKIDEADLKD